MKKTLLKILALSSFIVMFALAGGKEAYAGIMDSVTKKACQLSCSASSKCPELVAACKKAPAHTHKKPPQQLSHNACKKAFSAAKTSEGCQHKESAFCEQAATNGCDTYSDIASWCAEDSTCDDENDTDDEGSDSDN